VPTILFRAMDGGHGQEAFAHPASLTPAQLYLMACAAPVVVPEMPAWLTAFTGAGVPIEFFGAALAIPSAVFCSGDSICEVCPTVAWFCLT
jgi:hypothetical protein